MTRISDPWLRHPATQRVCLALTSGGAVALFVGGCVRNALLAVPVSDIDIATDAHPERVMELAKAAGVRAVPTGIGHGTVTLIEGGVPHEVTTFRRDISTDGRRAVVAFASRVEEDAARRDFTMNALYAQPDGSVLDPLGGLPDLESRRVRFIGSAQNRIREDYLRSLRYFRFHAWYGDPEQGFDPVALDAIAANVDGLSQLSRERVGAEMMKLLAAPDPAPSLAAMRATGVLGQILPGAEDKALAPLVHLEREAGSDPDPVLRLAALGLDDPGPMLRLSRSYGQRLIRVREAATGTATSAELGYRLGARDSLSALLLRAALLEQPVGKGVFEQIAKGACAEFPVKPADLMPELSGKALGDALKQLEARWIQSGFVLTRDALLQGLGPSAKEG